jgi:hypothetical protein
MSYRRVLDYLVYMSCQFLVMYNVYTRRTKQAAFETQCMCVQYNMLDNIRQCYVLVMCHRVLHCQESFC